MEHRKTLSLSRPLSFETLVKIKVKRSSDEKKKKIALDQKNRAKRINTALNWLYQRYPDCFNKKDPKPLKLNIEQDILNDMKNLSDQNTTPSKNSVRDALKYYTHSLNYLRSHLKYTERIDLNGQALSGSPVTAQQIDYAQARLNRMLTKDPSQLISTTSKSQSQLNLESGLDSELHLQSQS